MNFLKGFKLRFSTKFTFILCVVISALVIVESQHDFYSLKREKCQLFCQTGAFMFQSEMAKYEVVNDIIESLLLETNGNISNFDKVGETITAKLPAIDCIQLAPRGIVTKTYPLSAYDKIGTNLFDEFDTKIGSSYALKTKNSYLTGPVTFSSGKNVIIIQHPIFLNDAKGKEKFWGFSIVMLKTHELFSENALNFFEDSPYFFKLWKPDFQTEEIYDIVWNSKGPFKNPCEAIFKVANSRWTVYTVPKTGWTNWSFLLIQCLTALLASALLAVIVGFLFSLKGRDSALADLSYRDSLTSLYNARKFIDTLKQMTRLQKPYTLIYLDLNDFKEINDSLGHETGDQVLMIMGRKLSNCIRNDDIAFRIGGDEFAVILPGNHEQKFVEMVINRIKTSAERENVLRNVRLTVSTSAGYSRYPLDSQDYEEIIKIADKAMYEDKHKIKEQKNKEKEDLKK